MNEGVLIMGNDRDLLQHEMTREELNVLVSEYLAKGGTITQCKPGVALNFRAGVLTEEVQEKKKVRIIKKKKSAKKKK